LVGLLGGILIVLVVKYASSSFQSKAMVLMISLIIVGSFSLAVPVHADYGIVQGFGVGQQANTEPCQVLDVQTQNMKECAGLAATVYKDISEQDSSNDYYLVQMTVFAMNGTNQSCFESNLPCNYPIVATSIYNAAIGISLSSGGSASLGQGGYGPGPGCTYTQTAVSPQIGGVGVNLMLPGQCTSWNSSPNYNWNITVDSPCWVDAPFCFPNVFSTNGGHADFFVQIIVPEDASFTATFNARLTLTYCTVVSYCEVNSIEGLDSNAGYNLSGSLYVDPSSYVAYISPSPAQLQEVCMQTEVHPNGVCDTEPYGGTEGFAGPTVTATDNSGPGTLSMSSQVPSGWVYSWQYPSITLTSPGQQATDVLSVGAPYGQVAGWYYITVTATSSSNTMSIVIPVYYGYQGGGGGKTNGICPD
jgi:hypothetical protein